MTWEEISKRYEQDRSRARAAERRPRLEKWDNLVKSTDKLVWLFSLSSGGRLQQQRGGSNG